MYLLIDAGNSRLKFGCHDGTRWLVQQAQAHDAPLSLPAGFEPRRVVIANVAGEAVAERLRSTLGGWDLDWLQGSDYCMGLHNGYARPAQLGVDRWAAAIGAWQRVGGACLVVGAGTATTVDVIQRREDGGGRFLGGLILPGLAMMRAALSQGTAGLPLVRSSVRDAHAVPDNTADAIASGCLQATLGAVQRVAAQLPGAPILLHGGAADALGDHMPAGTMAEPALVLEGLLCVARSRDNPPR
ncbi:MAG: type III pantothenate kinase [Moraxellaceae bacterium]|nr:type III pantothenate kinase [Moraxellaceae bacterium]